MRSKTGISILLMMGGTKEVLARKHTYNYFDQNRFFAGFAYSTNATDHLQFGYMNIFQQLPSGNNYRSTNIARVVYLHNLDLRKKNANQ